MIFRKLIIDEYSELFDIDDLEYIELKSEYNLIRDYAKVITGYAPQEFQEGNLLEQQICEIIKNAIKHGNKSDNTKTIKVWYSFKKRVRFIVEDEGEGFQNLDMWNDFFIERQKALHEQNFDKLLDLASYKGPTSDAGDGGNSLIAAIDYWNGGIVYNNKKNKVGVVRWYTGGSCIP